ncbi:eukaryotic initiation factor 4f, putative [Perkinsus marinus ATCC 50983]|uniref:Eukaryotic initiation factor 4f, putative n=1 Tax=Perkinsus marinus (strain ATCC 50983 / TXsc) TaxID=423536 RepID=C5L006_PERM5|nr:eukaryotic initiation factor 4f, putative [Perkinsus marinus ATCC 50983]EER09864.1 eukaryotic initiation factor 4f, putative [Perkinsus marinus ATCC 50983]|eukprot:XP_002778069.1 eukaryotic initiation factor 4f, putative [Perkinsus marinus ATCC 50983]
MGGGTGPASNSNNRGPWGPNGPGKGKGKGAAASMNQGMQQQPPPPPPHATYQQPQQPQGCYYTPSGGYMMEEMGMPQQFVHQGYGFAAMPPYMAYGGPTSQPPPPPMMSAGYGYQMAPGMGPPGGAAAYYVPMQGMPYGMPGQEYPMQAAMMTPPPPQHLQGGYPGGGMYAGAPPYGTPMDSGGPMSAPPMPRPGSGPQQQQPPHSGATIGNASDTASGIMGGEESHLQQQAQHLNDNSIQQSATSRGGNTPSGGPPSRGSTMGPGARPFPGPPRREGSATSVPGGRPRKPLTIIDPSTGQEVKLVDQPATSTTKDSKPVTSEDNAAVPAGPTTRPAARVDSGVVEEEKTGETRPTTAATTGRPVSRQRPVQAAVAAGGAPTGPSADAAEGFETVQPHSSGTSSGEASHHDDYRGVNDRKKLLNAALRKPLPSSTKPPLIDSKHPKQQQAAPPSTGKPEGPSEASAQERDGQREDYAEHGVQQQQQQLGFIPAGGVPPMYPMGGPYGGMPPYGTPPPSYVGPQYGAPMMQPQQPAMPMYPQPPQGGVGMMMPMYPQPGLPSSSEEVEMSSPPPPSMPSEPSPQQPPASGDLSSSSAAKSGTQYGGRKLAFNKAIAKKSPTVAVTSPTEKEVSTAPTSGTAAAANEPVAPHVEGPNHLGETSAVTLERKKLFSRAIGKPKVAVTPPPPPQQQPEPVQEEASTTTVEASRPEAVPEAPVSATKPALETPPPTMVSLAKKRGFKNIPIDRSAVHPSPVVAPQPVTVPGEHEQEGLPESAAVITSSVPTPETEAASKDKDSWEETSSSEGEPLKAAGVPEELTEGEETPSAQSSEESLSEPLPFSGPLSRNDLLRMFLVAPATEAFRGDTRPIDFADETPPPQLVTLSVASTSQVRQPGGGTGGGGGLRRTTSKGMMGQRPQGYGGGGGHHLGSGDWRKDMLGPQAMRDKYNRQQSRQQYKRSNAPVVPLKVTEHGYKVAAKLEDVSPQEKLHRLVMSNLNRITAENFMQVTASLAELGIDEGWKLELVVRTIFDKAIQESYYCEIYSDMCMQLRRVLPEFEGDDINKPMTFTRALITKCQEEFEALPVDLAPTPEEEAKANGDAQELEVIRSKKKERILGNMKFIGQLFLRQLLSAKVIKEVVGQLIFRSDEPEEHYIECVCILLLNIGSTLDQYDRGRNMCTAFIRRLRDIKRLDYPSRLKFMIQDLIDNRSRGWVDRKGNPVGGRSKKAVKSVTLQGQEDTKRQAKLDEARRKMDELAIEKKEQKEAKERELQEARAFKVDKFKNSRDYFREDGDLKSFLNDVTAMVQNDPSCPSKMAENLVNWGAEDPRGAFKDAELIVELVRRGIIPFKVLNLVLRGFLEVLDDVAMDFPKAPEFYHRLFALLLVGDYSVAEEPSEFDPQLILSWKVLGSDERSFDLAVKVLEQAKRIAGVPGVHKGLHFLRPLMKRMKHLEPSDDKDLDEMLEEMGLLKDETEGLLDKLGAALKGKDFDAATQLMNEEASGDLLGGKNALFERRVISALISNLRLAWSKDSWTVRLKPAESLLRTVCGTGTETGVGSPNNCELHNQKRLIESLAGAIYDARLPSKDVAGIYRAFVDMGLVRQVVLQQWYSQTSTESDREVRKFSAEGLRRVVAGQSSNGDTPPESSAESLASPASSVTQ